MEKEALVFRNKSRDELTRSKMLTLINDLQKKIKNNLEVIFEILGKFIIFKKEEKKEYEFTKFFFSQFPTIYLDDSRIEFSKIIEIFEEMKKTYDNNVFSKIINLILDREIKSRKLNFYQYEIFTSIWKNLLSVFDHNLPKIIDLLDEIKRYEKNFLFSKIVKLILRNENVFNVFDDKYGLRDYLKGDKKKEISIDNSNFFLSYYEKFNIKKKRNRLNFDKPKEEINDVINIDAINPEIIFEKFNLFIDLQNNFWKEYKEDLDDLKKVNKSEDYNQISEKDNKKYFEKEENEAEEDKDSINILLKKASFLDEKNKIISESKKKISEIEKKLNNKEEELKKFKKKTIIIFFIIFIIFVYFFVSKLFLYFKKNKKIKK